MWPGRPRTRRLQQGQQRQPGQQRQLELRLRRWPMLKWRARRQRAPHRQTAPRSAGCRHDEAPVAAAALRDLAPDVGLRRTNQPNPARRTASQGEYPAAPKPGRQKKPRIRPRCRSRCRRRPCSRPCLRRRRRPRAPSGRRSGTRRRRPWRLPLLRLPLHQRLLLRRWSRRHRRPRLRRDRLRTRRRRQRLRQPPRHHRQAWLPSMRHALAQQAAEAVRNGHRRRLARRGRNPVMAELRQELSRCSSSVDRSCWSPSGMPMSDRLLMSGLVRMSKWVRRQGAVRTGPKRRRAQRRAPDRCR